MSPEPDDETGLPSLAHTLPDPGEGDEWRTPGAAAGAASGAAAAPAAAPAGATTTAAPATTTAPAAPPTPDETAAWKVLDDVKVDAFPEPMRPHATRIVELARAHEADLTRTRADMERHGAALSAVVEELKSKGAEAVGPQAAYVLDLHRQIRDATWDIARAQWRAFSAEHPAFETLPQAARDRFADLVAHGAVEHFPGEAMPDKLGGLLAFVAHQYGISLPPKGVAAPPQVVVAAPAGAGAGAAKGEAAKGEATKQALVTDGRAPPQKQATAPWTRAVDDILAQHDHLID